MVALLLTVDTSIEDVETIGILLICLDIGFIVASIVSIVISIWMLRKKFKSIQKKNNNNAPTKVIPVSHDRNQEKDQGKDKKDIKKENTDVDLNSIGYDDWNDEGESVVQVVKVQKENPIKKELLVKKNTIHFGDEIEEKETKDQVENDRVVKEEMMRQEEEKKQKQLQMEKAKELLMLQEQEKIAKEKELQQKKEEEKKKRKEAHVEKKKEKDAQVKDILLQRKNSTTRTRSKIKL